MDRRIIPMMVAFVVAAVVAVLIVVLTADRAAAPPTTAPASGALPDPPPDLSRRAVSAFRGPLPTTMPGSQSDTPKLIALGRRLYFERGLSVNNTQSCNDCHRIDDGLAGVDSRAVSPGALGTMGTRNSPTVLNAGFNVAQFWDGRAEHLAEQAMGPPLNPGEMAMRDPDAIVARLQELGYAADFAAAFPSDAQHVTFDHAAAAIAAFERTLLSRSRLDDYLGGDEQALSRHEQQGLDLFLSAGCVHCHAGPLVGGTMYQKVGLFTPYANQNDVGRQAVTGQSHDRFVFKVPALRNVSLTAPYFHDGGVPDLAKAVEHMGRMQLDRVLTADEVEAITAFLSALSDPARRSMAPAP